jgi:hypothetical protein
MPAFLGVGAAEGGPIFDLARAFQTTSRDDESFEKRRLADATATNEGDGAGLRVTGERNHGDLDSAAAISLQDIPNPETIST